MKILVRGTNWIGDAVMSVPALRELRRIFPDASIALHTRSWADGLFRDASFIDEIITFDKTRWKIKDVYDNSEFLKPDKFDLAILFPNSFESALTVFLARIPQRIGYNKDVRGLLLTDPIAVPEWKNRRHEVNYYLNLVAAAEKSLLGKNTVSNAIPDTTIEISAERRQSAKEQLHSFGIDSDRKTIALGVGSTNSLAKRWSAENYAQLNDRLQTDLNANVLLIGSKEESNVADEVGNLSKLRPINISGQTELDEATAILSEIDLLISNDMGLAHIAPAVGTRTIAIFGPTNPETTRPFSENAEVVRKDVNCSPCMLRDCPIDHRCMSRITVDEVFERAAAAFESEENANEDLEETTDFLM